jgi:hypothetical protein
VNRCIRWAVPGGQHGNPWSTGRPNHRTLQGAAQDRLRWDGRCVSGRGHHARPAGCAQGPAAGASPRHRAASAVHAGSESCRRAQPPQHRDRALRRRGRWRALHHDGVREGKDPGRGPAKARPRARQVLRDRDPAVRRARGSARARHHTPGSQTGQRDGECGRSCQGARFWPRQSGPRLLESRRHRGSHPIGHAGRPRRRDSVVHVARAGRRQDGGYAFGYFFAGRRVLRDVDRGTTLRRRYNTLHRLVDSEGHAAPGESTPARDST